MVKVVSLYVVLLQFQEPISGIKWGLTVLRQEVLNVTSSAALQKG